MTKSTVKCFETEINKSDYRFARHRSVVLFDMAFTLLLGKFRQPGFSGMDNLCVN